MVLSALVQQTCSGGSQSRKLRLFQALLSALEDKNTEEGKDEREPGVGDGE